jgi:hypothetical protein
MKRRSCEFSEEMKWLEDRRELDGLEIDLDKAERQCDGIVDIPPLCYYFEKKRRILKEKRKEVEIGASKLMKESYLTLFKNDNKFLFTRKLLRNEGLETCCTQCKTDFTPLVLIPDTFRRVGTNCRSCGYFLCYKCVVEKLHDNPLNEDSIGYHCPRCSFRNSNLVKDQNRQEEEEEDEDEESNEQVQQHTIPPFSNDTISIYLSDTGEDEGDEDEEEDEGDGEEEEEDDGEDEYEEDDGEDEYEGGDVETYPSIIDVRSEDETNHYPLPRW